MSDPLLEAPTQTNPSHTLALSQKARPYLDSRPWYFTTLPYPLSLFLAPESQERWAASQNLFLASLIADDLPVAYAYLEDITERFGKLNERVMALQGLYQEASAKDTKALEDVVKNYDELLKTDPTLMAIRKRRVAVLKGVGRIADAVGDLVLMLDASPTDAEAWAELADCYVSQGAYEQAVWCLEEVLLVMPNAWNMHARLAEVQYIQSQKMSEGSGEQLKTLSESMRRFCRSIELCDDYLRGYYGLKITTARLLAILEKVKKPPTASSDLVAGDLAPPKVATVYKLNELATAKLAEIVRRSSAEEKGWDGYSGAELKAAKAMIEKDTQKIER
ncbi:hypothetical protein BAUCODRAFT_318893 [Baudoinia panamericana UAMH 10762]|uniref:ER membrane protein complex subunit 2 n=1 Tax=Baudoinia panamericana (strain UAMH 10762) TaxID=717646 RepID=M2M3S8_BAUPA|nr:uncharacterized protein BAUCODRAFT_318893 [Baudoinia panamericana UAMH 10762]EMC91226.1 hypothetical protein BAUCODRAFT_318893 [Baudoinia panamericana UAMH 10762]